MEQFPREDSRFSLKTLQELRKPTKTKFVMIKMLGFKSCCCSYGLASFFRLRHLLCQVHMLDENIKPRKLWRRKACIIVVLLKILFLEVCF